MSLLWTLVWLIAAGVALLLLLLLVTPLTARLRFESTPRSRWRLGVGVLGGVLRFPVYDSASSAKPPRPPASEHEQEPAKAPSPSASGGPSRTRLLRRVPRLLLELFGCIRIDHARLDCTFGFDDPADTGSAYGLLAPLLFASPWRQQLSVQPDFSGERFSGEGDVSLRLTPVCLVAPALTFAWEVWRP